MEAALQTSAMFHLSLLNPAQKFKPQLFSEAEIAQLEQAIP